MSAAGAYDRGMSISLRHLYRYPVKGMNAEAPEAVALEAGRCLPGDRRFAIAHAASRCRPEAPEWQPPDSFVMLKRSNRLARIRQRFDPAEGRLTMLRDGKDVASGHVESAAGRMVIDQFLTAFLAEDARGSAHLVEAPGTAFSDVPEKWLSLINLASVQDLERVVRAPVDPLRFRANLYIDGLEPWREFGWVGREIVIGSARLRVTERIERCAATNVNPATAARDLNIPKSLNTGFGHVDMGVYVEVVAAGTVRVGDAVAPPDQSSPAD